MRNPHEFHFSLFSYESITFPSNPNRINNRIHCKKNDSTVMLKSIRFPFQSYYRNICNYSTRGPEADERVGPVKRNRRRIAFLSFRLQNRSACPRLTAASRGTKGCFDERINPRSGGSSLLVKNGKVIGTGRRGAWSTKHRLEDGPWFRSWLLGSVEREGSSL